MDDSAAVARHLFDHWLAPNVVRVLSAPFGNDIAVARVAYTFLAGVHDIGKATPAFAVQDNKLAQEMRNAGLWMPNTKRDLDDRSRAHHAVAGHHILTGWLTGQGWSIEAACTWGIVVGGHHGVPPDDATESAARPEDVPCLYGKDQWDSVRTELVEWVAARSGASAYLDGWRDLALPQQAQVLATALVIVSDWIASNVDLFPFFKGLPEVRADQPRAATALGKLRLPAPWQAEPPEGPIDKLYAQRFTLPADAAPRPVQVAALDLARRMPEPGLLVIEAPMGEGKTEAALAAVEVLAERFQAGGMFLALPTQATSDAIFTRVLHWLDRIKAGGGDPGGSIALSHGKAGFNRQFQELVALGRMRDVGRDDESDDRHAKRRQRALDRMRQGDPGRSGQDPAWAALTEHALAAHSWLMGRKKTHLANVVIGTIDQLLFAGLKARHLMLRHLALAGKVVVIDEIHAYDAYMNSYLTKVLTWLGRYGVPVVALSATLPSGRRQELVTAYQAGCRQAGRQGARRRRRSREAVAPDQTAVGYPLLTWTEGEAVRSQSVAASARKTTVHVEALDDELSSLVTALREALADGGCALVIRNTVRRVLAAAEAIEAEFPGEVTVAHARYIVADRLRNDNDLLSRFGPPDGTRQRPRRHIVVASQVAEQSLDVDFDLLVTDLAPIDLVLQRMGRLHRHVRDGRPERLRVPRTFITGADFSQNPPTLDQAAERHVYGAHALLRSAAVLAPRFGATISLPDDIAPLVEGAYGGERIGLPEWHAAMDEAAKKWEDRTERREDRASDFQISPPRTDQEPIFGWIAAGVGEADEESQGRGQVREGAPQLEAILVQTDRDGRWHTPAWLDDGRGNLPVPRDEKPSDQFAEVLGSCTIRLPLEFSDEQSEKELWEATPVAWELSPMIYRLPVLVVDEHGWGEVDGRRLRYTTQRGLEVFTRDE